jgi:adenylate cyclase
VPESLPERAYRRWGSRYLLRALFLQQQLIYPVLVAAVAALSLFVGMSFGEFLRLAALGCALQVVYVAVTQRVERRLIEPVTRWIAGARDERQTREAWQVAASLPMRLLRDALFGAPLGPLLWVSYIVWSAYMTWELGLPAYAGVLAYLVAGLVICYASFLRFFGIERVVRPVLCDIANALPDGAAPPAPGLSLRGRLLAALPAINIITAVVAYGLARGGHAKLIELITVLGVATAVAASVSLVLTMLLASSITDPITQLREATRRVAAGDFQARLPVVTTDETGELTSSFNAMTAGLADRERIRDAFGTYVDRDVAEHIMREGTSLAGEEVEITAMFLDIREFTSYAERSRAPDVVATLNQLFERIVPIIHDHAGHVDKFVGDGLLAVFGAPRRHDEHADQALAAAIKIARAVADEFGDKLSVGIGLNSGNVVAGNIGGAGRLEFSVIGDAVNVAARVESATRQTGDTILVSEHTRRLLRHPKANLTKRPPITLKGKRKPVALYSPEDSAPPRTPVA